MNYIVGAYAASPTAAAWDPELEAQYLAQVAALPGFRGLELPFTGVLHRDEQWLLDHLGREWDLVLTAIPGTVARVAADPAFGLASTEHDGRIAAVEFTAALRSAVTRINDRTGRRSVLAVELHSAPTANGSATEFARSLGEIAQWDWDGAALTVEHCDAIRPEQPAQKGYLSLADELAVVAEIGPVAGVTVNWGRSAIEGRAAATAVEHIQSAVAADALTGLMFSGAAGRPGPFGEPWLDAHLPPSTEDDPEFADLRAVESTSLLGPAEIAAALRACAGAAQFTGIKIGVRPTDLPLDERVDYLRTAVELIDRVHSLHPTASRAG